jgi:DNA-binding transcriptional regulator YiaG
MKKSVFAAEFEERTGFKFGDLFISAKGTYLKMLYWFNKGVHDTTTFAIRTKSLYTRAHLEAAIGVVGEKEMANKCINFKMGERQLVDHVRSGEFSIDDDGHIWRTARAVGLRYTGGAKLHLCKPRRAERMSPDGYLRVAIKRNGKSYSAMAHRLIWQYFYGDIPEYLCVNHINGIKTDNRLCNLELVTHKQNSEHALAIGLYDNQMGELNCNAKLSADDVLIIRSAYKSGCVTQAKLSRYFGVSDAHVSRIIFGQARKCDPGPVTNHCEAAGEKGSER